MAEGKYNNAEKGKDSNKHINANTWLRWQVYIVLDFTLISHPVSYSKIHYARYHSKGDDDGF